MLIYLVYAYVALMILAFIDCCPDFLMEIFAFPLGLLFLVLLTPVFVWDYYKGKKT